MDEYWKTIDKHHAVEGDFKKAMKSQKPSLATQGRVAVLRAGDSTGNENWTTLWSPARKASQKVPSPPLAQDDGIPNADALLFEDYKVFEKALKEMDDMNHNSGQFFQRQVILLEDLGFEWVKVLWKHFNIPPRFFALHWTAPENHITGEVRLPLGQSISQHFVLPYQEVLPLRLDKDDRKQYIQLDSTVSRAVTRQIQARKAPEKFEDVEERRRNKKQKKGDPIDRRAEMSSHQLSYWGKFGPDGHSGESWTAILLVDSKPSSQSKFLQVRTDSNTGQVTVTPTTSTPLPDLDSSAERVLQRPLLSQGDLLTRSPNEITRPTIVSFPSEQLETRVKVKLVREDEMSDNNTTDEKQVVEDFYPISRPIFDELLQNHRANEMGIHHPLCSTTYARRLLLAKTSIIVGVIVDDALNLAMEAMAGINNIMEFDLDKLESHAWSDDWKAEFFTFLWSLREDTEMLGFVMSRNRRLLSKIVDLINRDNSLKKSQDSLHKSQDSHDLEEWAELEESRKYASDIISRTTDSYMQTVQATAAKYANFQAKSSKKMTGLATLFVPASLAAAVLAIPSFAGANDTQKFWIFWVVSVPLAAILALVLMSPKWFQKLRFKLDTWISVAWIWISSIPTKKEPSSPQSQENLERGLALELQVARRQASLYADV